MALLLAAGSAPATPPPTPPAPTKAVSSADAAPAATPAATALPVNGDFERPDPAAPDRPAGWDRPDGLGVRWADAAPGDPHGRHIRMDTRITEQAMVERWRTLGMDGTWDIPNPARNPIAATYGLSYYSAAMPVVSGQTYRITFDYRGPTGGAKVWVRGYGPLGGQMRRRYETVVHCRERGPGWHTIRQEFNPTRHRPEVTEMKVMLYAYWPADEYAFDNVRLEPVTTAAFPPPADPHRANPARPELE